MANQMSEEQRQSIIRFTGWDPITDVEKPRDWGKFAKDALSHSWILAAPALLAGAPGIAAGGAGSAGSVGSLGGGGKLAGAARFVGKNWKELLTGGTAVMGALDQRKQRSEAQAFDQSKLDTLKAFLAKWEGEFDRRAPLREASQSSILSSLSEPGLIRSQLK